MMSSLTKILLIAGACLMGSATTATAENLYKPNQSGALVGDIKASQVGDVLTVAIVQRAEARNSTRNVTERRNSGGVNIFGLGVSDSVDLDVGTGYRGRGEIARSASFLTHMSATIESVYPNGDYQIVGSQFISINEETTEIFVRGRVRPYDIGPNNAVLSSRIANAEIQYEGQGFLTKATNPGLVRRIFNILGL